MWRVELTQAAVESIQTLREVDREAVLHAVGRLSLGPNPPGAPQPHRLSNRPDLTVLQAGERYRVAYTVDGTAQLITIVDIVAHDRILRHPDSANAA